MTQSKAKQTAATQAEQPAELIDSKEEQALIQRAQQGEKAAFGALVSKYMRRAYFTALGFVGQHEAALDLSQEAFVRAYHALHRFDPQRKFFTWYYQILRNLCFNFLRDQSKRARPFSDIGERRLSRMRSVTPDAQKISETHEIQEIVWKALHELDKHAREIILLKDFQDYSYKEIAELLHCPVGTVMSRLYTARQALKAKLMRYLDDPAS